MPSEAGTLNSIITRNCSASGSVAKLSLGAMRAPTMAEMVIRSDMQDMCSA